MKLLFVVAFALCLLFDIAASTDCLAPDSEPGECKTVDKCPSLAGKLTTLAAKKFKTSEDVEFLKKSLCPELTSDGRRQVCCPKPPLPKGGCYTPDGEVGSCISIYLCSHLVNLLKPPISNTHKEYIKNSACDSNIQYSVCCGPPPNCTALMNAFPPDSRTDCCGVDSRVGNKLVGAKEAAIDQYPWAVIIEYVHKTGDRYLLCGGVLISGKYVLTAAHCVRGPVLETGVPTTVRLGEYDTSNDGPDCAIVEAEAEDCNEGVIRIDIEKVIPHPKYFPTNYQKTNDIALLRLKRTAPFTYFIRPICLPSSDWSRYKNESDPLIMYAAGWGAIENSPFSNIKLHVDLPIVSHETCQEIYDQIESNKTIHRSQLCAGGVSGKDACRGDSGGPLMYEDGRVTEVVGIVSYGIQPCGKQEIPGVYSNVYEHLGWIKDTIVP
ncbi:unnamed protein product [Chrysodeixis includens]|uniref:CLIP domain-containing serine protease n=1 Tax=Chrysodeixis includens TaxID=689277 RepID=A0A9P0FTI9_CHRIL|nr:unnamed protein product [Chrysodeixis includens]